MTRTHGPSKEIPLTDDDVAAPDHAERARTLVAGQRTGALGTLTEDGFPYPSYVTFALFQGDPVFLVSKMASHTHNLEGDDRASLLVSEDVADDPLANGRVTLVGRCRPTAAAEVREAFLARHPEASYYVDFEDFGFYRLAVERIRYIGGYGRMSWVEAEAWQAARPDPIAESARGIIDHMNEDHADALVAYAQAFTRAAATERATMTGVDRYGFELSVETDKGPRPARIAFDAPLVDGPDARSAMVALLKRAREQLASSSQGDA